MSDEKERGFVVIDKRGREEEEAEEASEAPPTEEARELPRPDFASLVISLGTSALYHLGLMNDPETGQPAAPDLALARQAIDTVEVLEEKTRGNLDDEEQKLLQGLLTDLRMRYVEATRGPGKGAG